MVVVEKTTESAAATDASAAVVIGRFGGRRGHLALEPLVEALGLVVLDKLGDQVSEVALSEDDEVVQAFVPDGPNEAFGETDVTRGILPRDAANPCFFGREMLT